MIVAAIATSDVGISVAREVSRLVCVVAGGPTASARPSTPSGRQVRRDEHRHGDRARVRRRGRHRPPGERVRRNGDGPTGDAEANAVHENFGVIFDYFQEKFGRRSYDDKV